MTKRKLNDSEKAICEKSIIRLTEEQEYLKFDLEHLEMRKKHEVETNNFMIAKGFKQIYKKRMLNFEKELYGQNRELNIMVAQIETLQDQIKNGVEQKEAK